MGQVSGAGTASFSQPASLTTGVSFSGPGTYLLALEAVGNGTFTGDQIAVTVDDTYEAWAGRRAPASRGKTTNGMGSPTCSSTRSISTRPWRIFIPSSRIPLSSDIVFDYTRYLRKIDSPTRRRAQPT